MGLTFAYADPLPACRQLGQGDHCCELGADGGGGRSRRDEVEGEFSCPSPVSVLVRSLWLSRDTGEMAELQWIASIMWWCKEIVRRGDRDQGIKKCTNGMGGREGKGGWYRVMVDDQAVEEEAMGTRGGRLSMMPFAAFAALALALRRTLSSFCLLSIALVNA